MKMKRETRSRLDSVVMTKDAILDELRGEMKTYHESYKEGDGVVRNEGALEAMRALQLAVEIVKRA